MTVKTPWLGKMKYARMKTPRVRLSVFVALTGPEGAPIVRYSGF